VRKNYIHQCTKSKRLCLNSKYWYSPRRQINNKSGEEGPSYHNPTQISHNDSRILRYYRFSEHIPANVVKTGLVGGFYALLLLTTGYVALYWLQFHTSSFYRFERRVRNWKNSMTPEYAKQRAWVLRQQISHYFCVPDNTYGDSFPEDVKKQVFDAPTRKQWHKDMTLHTIKKKLEETNMQHVNVSPLTMTPSEFCFTYDASNPIKKGCFDPGFSESNASDLASQFVKKR